MNARLSESSAIAAFAGELEKALVGRTIRYMQGFKDGLPSGEDSGLENFWDEFCVQVQFQDSVFRSHYDDIITAFLAEQIRRLSPHQQAALWLQTDKGLDWRFEEEEARDADPVCMDHVVQYLWDSVQTAAANYGNLRITRYLDRGDWE